MTRQPNEKFAVWATQYQGFDGGNPNASIWFCGIEYGGGDDLVTKELLDDLEGDWVEWQVHEGNKLPYFTPRDKQGNLIDDKVVDGPFAIAQSKMMPSQKSI